MPRIRSIKPEFWCDATLARMDFFTRLFYIALWNFADDEGRGRAIARELAGFAFPLNDEVSGEDVERAIVELAEAGRITLYEVSGVRHYQVIHWQEHQSVNRPTKSRIPPPTDYKTPQLAFPNGAPDNQNPLSEPSVNTHGALSEPSVSPHVNCNIGIRNQEAGSRSQELGGRQQAVGARASVSEVHEGSALPALPFDASVFFSALPTGVQSEFPWHKWLDLQNGRGKWTLREIAWGVEIVMERKKLPDDIAAMLHTAILPEVRAGKRPKSASVPARASPEVAVNDAAENTRIRAERSAKIKDAFDRVTAANPKAREEYERFQDARKRGTPDAAPP